MGRSNCNGEFFFNAGYQCNEPVNKATHCYLHTSALLTNSEVSLRIVFSDYFRGIDIEG